MRIFDINKWFLRLLPAVVAFGLGLVVGAIWTTNTAYDTGYKMATMEMQRLLQEGLEGNIDFYIEGMPFKFRPQKDRRAIQLIPETKRKI